MVGGGDSGSGCLGIGGGGWTEALGQQKQSNDPGNNPAHPQHANYWAPLTRKRHTIPHSAQPRHTNDWAPRTRKRHQQEHRPQRPTERSDPTQHAKGRVGDCPGPRKETATRRNVTRGGVLLNREWGVLLDPLSFCHIRPRRGDTCGGGGGGGGVGTRPRYRILCLWRRLLASRHCHGGGGGGRLLMDPGV